MGEKTFPYAHSMSWYVRPQGLWLIMVNAHQATLGVLAASWLMLSAWLFALICLLGTSWRRNDVLYPAPGVYMSVLVGIHSPVDFSLPASAVRVTYAFVMGIACAQSWSSRNSVSGGAG